MRRLTPNVVTDNQTGLESISMDERDGGQYIHIDEVQAALEEVKTLLEISRDTINKGEDFDIDIVKLNPVQASYLSHFSDVGDFDESTLTKECVNAGWVRALWISRALHKALKTVFEVRTDDKSLSKSDWDKAEAHFNGVLTIYIAGAGMSETKIYATLKLFFEPMAMRFESGERSRDLYNKMLSVKE